MRKDGRYIFHPVHEKKDMKILILLRSFAVIRSHLVDVDYLAAQKQKEEKMKKKEQEAKKLAFDTSNFQVRY